MEPTSGVVAWLSLGLTILAFVSTGLAGYILKVRGDFQREVDKLTTVLQRQQERIETIEDQVTSWQLETLRAHPTKQDLREMEQRIIDRVNILLNGGYSGRQERP